MRRERFLRKHAAEIRRLKARYLPQIVDKKGHLVGVKGQPGVPKYVRESADTLIKLSQEFGFFENYQGFTKCEKGDWYHLVHSPTPHYNAEKFTEDVEFLTAEAEKSVETAPPKVTLQGVLVGVAATVAAGVILTGLNKCLFKE